MGKLLHMGINPMRLSEELFERALSFELVNTEYAKTLYQQAISTYPYNIGATNNLANIFFYEGDFASAEQLYRQTITIKPECAMAHFNLANLLERNQRNNEALKHYLLATEIDSKYADAYYNLAILLNNMGCRMEAAKQWVRYLKLDPESDWAHVARSELKKIITIYRKA